MAIHLHENSCQELKEDQSTVIPDGILYLQKMQTRIKAVEKTVVGEMERLATQESINTNIKVEDVMEETEDLKPKGTLHQKKGIRKEEMELGNDLESRKTKPENGILMKDIPLDQVSDSSFYGRSRIDNGRADDQMLELWETAEQECSQGPMVNETQKQASAPVEDVAHHKFEDRVKSQDPSLELQIEKELGIDKLEISTSVTEPNQDVNKGKFLERLASDGQKLMSLQTTLQDLKKRMEMNKRSKKASDIEYETVKRQLQEVEESVLQLVDVNDKLTKDMEDSPSSLDGRPSVELEEAGNVHRKRVTEQASKGSEKIGHLQFELQNIECILLKLEDEKKSKGKYRFPENRTGSLLRDFIYSGGRRNQRRRKKSCFCGCTRPSTDGD
jgi:hypothetical protein